MKLYQADLGETTVFEAGKDEEDAADRIRERANKGEISPVFAFLEFRMREIEVPGFDITVRAKRKKDDDKE